MNAPTSSTDTKRDVLKRLLIDGLQTVKIVVQIDRLDPSSGFPTRVLASPEYIDGMPLDLNPRWPMEFDFDTGVDVLLVSLSFGGTIHRCMIPYSAISTIAIGLGKVAWEHEAKKEDTLPHLRPVRSMGHLSLLEGGAQDDPPDNVS